MVLRKEETSNQNLQYFLHTTREYQLEKAVTTRPVILRMRTMVQAKVHVQNLERLIRTTHEYQLEKAVTTQAAIVLVKTTVLV